MADIYEPAEEALETRVQEQRPAVRFDPAQAQQNFIQRQAERQAGLDRYKIELSVEEYDRLNTLYPTIFPDEQSEEEHQNNQYRLGTAMKLSRMYNIPIEDAYANLDAILETAFTKELPPPTAWRAVSDAFAIAGNNERLNTIGLELRNLPKGSEGRNALWKEMQQLREENISLKDPLQRSFFFEGAKTIAESSVFSLKGSVAGGLGSVIHPVVGMIAGAATAALSTVGLEYLDLLESGVDDDIAWRTAMVSSGIQGVLEGLSADIPIFRNSGAGQQLFKMLHNGGKFGAFAKAAGAAGINMLTEGLTEVGQEAVSQQAERIAKKSTEERVREIIAQGKSPEDEALDKAASDLATAAYEAYLKIAEANPDALLSRASPEERRAALWESFRGAILSSAITGVPIAIRDTVVNIDELRQIDAVMKTAPDMETANEVLEKTGNKTYENFTADTRQELFTAHAQERERAEAAAEAEYRRTRLYRGEDQSEGPEYRDQDGRLYAENIRHTESSGVTTGTYQAGNPAKSEENTYGKITYELEGGRAVIDQVRIAGNYETLKGEILQGFANDLNQEVSWEGVTYTPQEGAAPAVHIGWDDEARKTPQTAAAGPARADTGGLEDDTVMEQQFLDRLKKAMPQLTDLESRAVLEQFRIGADLQNRSFAEYAGTYFQEGVFADTDANELAAGQGKRGGKKGAARFDPETGKALLSGSTWADFSTASHEFAHALRRQLSGDYLAEAERVFGVENGRWTEDKEEAFARAYEQYLETGKAPTSKLAELFKKFKEFMGRIYRLVKNEGGLTPERQAFFDRIFRDAEANRERRGEQGRTPSAAGYDAEINRRVDELNREGRARAEELAREQGASGEPVEEVLFQADTEPEDEVLNDPAADYTEKARAAVDKAGKVYAIERLDPTDRQHGPTAVLIARAMNITDPVEREKVIGEIRALRNQYAGTEAEYQAPNGKPSLLLEALGEEQGKQAWYAVRTPSFKEWFGDWERAVRIAQLEKSPNLKLDGNAYEGKYDISGTPKENKKSIEAYLKNLKGLRNDHINGPIELGGTGIGKITSWGMNNQTYMKTIAHIPTMLKNAVLISENGPNRANSHYQSFRHLVTGIELDGEPYTVHIVLGENAGIWYYQHILSKIEKGTLIEVIRETNSGLQDSLSDIKDTTLREILQAPNTSKVIDANGEPLAVFRGDKAGLDRFLNKQGIYHAADAEIAKGYSSGGVYKNFLNIKNPLVLNSENRFNKIRDDINDMIYDILEQDWPELENNRRFQDLRKNYLAFRNEEGSTVRDFYNDFLPEVSEETDLEEFKEILLKSLHDTNTFNWRQIDFRDIDILNPYIQTLGYDGIIRPYDSQGQSVGKEYITFSPSQIKSATDNAGIYGRENPSILFQDEAALAAFIRNDPEVVDLAGTFDSWEDFMGYYEVFDEKQPADLRETAAREGFYKTLWEEAKRLGDRETAAETADTGQKTVEDFLDLVNSETGLREIVEGTRGILAEADHFQPESAEEERRYNAELRAVKSAFDHQNWKNARIQLSKDKPISPATARFLRGQVRNNPLPYMQAWAVISGDDSWLPAEQRSRLDSGEDFEAETDTSPEELRRIQQALDYDEVVQKIEDETIQMVDPRLENYEEELKRRQQESREKIDKTKERLSDYAWWIERAEINIHGQERLLAQLKADTTPEGLRAHGRQQRKIKALQNQLLNLRKEYARFFQSVKAADKANFKDFTTLVRMQAKTEQSLEAIRDLRQIRKREIRALTRKPDLNTVHIDEAYLIQWIQSHFDKLYEAIPKFIGKKAKNLQQLFSDFTTQEEYRAELRRKLSPASYRRIEEGVYKDPATREVRPYSELTRAQRHTLYRLLLENEKLFKDVGLDDMEAPKQFSPAESERIRKDLEDRLPPHIIRKLETRVPLDQWQMADVETLAGIMGDIRKEGREHYKARRDAREKVISDYRQQFTEMTGKLLRPQDLARLPGAETEEAEKKRAAPWNLIYGGINARRMIRMMIDGGKDGLGYDVIIGGEDRAFNEQTRHELRRRKVVEERLEAAGIKLKELWSNTFSVDQGEAAKISRSLDEMLFYRRAALNDRAYRAVVFGNFATPKELAALETAYREGRMVDALAIQDKIEKRYNDAIGQLDAFLAKPENAKFRQVETIIGEDYDGNYDRLKEFAAREFNFDMGSEAFYIPLSRLEATGDLMEQETIRDVFSSAGVVQSLAKGFTLSRVDIPPWGQMPVKAGLYKTWDQMVTKQEHLMAYAGYLREMRQIFQGRGSEVLMSNIQRRFTLAGKDYLTHYISELANPNPQRDYTNLDTITRLMRGHYPAAVLAFRLSSIIKQAITSPPPFLQFVSAAQYAGAAARCLSEETRKMIREKSAYMASRVIDPANEFIRQMELSSLMGKSGKVQAALTKAESIGMKGLEWIDSVCVMPGWLAAYDQKRAELNRQEGTDPTTIEAEAVKYADQVVRDTQPSSRQVDLAPIFKHQKNPFMQMFLQFQVPQSVIMQNLFVDAPNNFKQGRAGAALTTFALYGLTAAVVGILEEDEDEEKLNPKYRGIDAAVGYLESIPIAGGYASYTVEHFLRTGKVKLSQFKPFPVLDEAFRAGAAVTQEQWDQAFSRSLRALGYYSGLPVGLWGEIDKAIKDGDWTVLLGWK